MTKMLNWSNDWFSHCGACSDRTWFKWFHPKQLNRITIIVWLRDCGQPSPIVSAQWSHKNNKWMNRTIRVSVLIRGPFSMCAMDSYESYASAAQTNNLTMSVYKWTPYMACAHQTKTLQYSILESYIWFVIQLNAYSHVVEEKKFHIVKCVQKLIRQWLIRVALSTISLMLRNTRALIILVNVLEKHEFRWPDGCLSSIHVNWYYFKHTL